MDHPPETAHHATDRGAGKVSRSIELAREPDGINEQSPLLPPRASEDVEPIPPLDGVFSPSESSSNSLLAVTSVLERNSHETKSSWYLFLLTLSMFGLQIAWSVELSNGSPYLLSLGISKSWLALVWIAGPLSGTLVQPYVGIKSDRCRSRFGKRRPFMVGGGAATIVSLLALAWTRELIGGFLHLFGAPEDSQAVATTAMVFAVLMIYVLDFAINVIQAGVRAFIVDNAPAHQQDSANAWASRISGVGNIVGYLFGYVDLPSYFWFFGDTEFKILCMVASLAMIITLTISCLSVTERDPRLEGTPDKQDEGVLAFSKDLYHSVRKLPPQIKRVCEVQFFAWIGWFPFLFYITTYISEIYVGPHFAANPNMTPEEIDKLWQKATRIGTLALFIFAIVNFAASVLLPFIVASSVKASEPPLRTPMTATASEGATTPLAANGFANIDRSYFDYLPPQPISNDLQSPKYSNHTSVSRRTTMFRILFRIPSLQIPWLTLRRAWLLSHATFAVLTFSTFFVHTTTSATILVALIGIPWAMTNWAPFALIAAEIRSHSTLPHMPGNEVTESAPQAGVVLGIHNVAIAAPQVIATLVSSAIFRALQKPRGSVGDESVAWVLRFGGLAALVACWLTRRVGEARA